MGKNLLRITFVLALSLVLLLASVSAEDSSEDTPVVVLSSHDWIDKFLVNNYAASIGAEFITFENLGQAELKTSTIEKSKRVLVFESSSPVVKNYDAYLEVNGYDNREVIRYKDYYELQEILYDMVKPVNFILLDPAFSLEAIAASPMMVNEGLFPMFVDGSNKKMVKKLVKHADQLILAGHFPVRVSDGFSGQKFLDYSDTNAIKLMQETFSKTSSEWGFIVRPDQLDLSVLRTGIPILVYSGDIPSISKIVRDNSVDKFEVVGGKSVDVAQAIEGESGKNLKMMLRYGRSYSGASGFEGKIFDIDSVIFPFPSPDLELVGSTFYPSLDTIGLRFKSNGNIPTKFYTNVEFAGNALSDEHYHIVFPGEEITIPYKLDEVNEGVAQAIINTKYDFRTPMRHGLLGDNDKPIIVSDVELDSRADDPHIEVKSASFDDDNGELSIGVENSGDDQLFVLIELMVKDELLSSQKQVIPGSSQGHIIIPAPFIRGDDMYGLVNITVFYGNLDTLHTFTREVLVVRKRSSMNLFGNVILTSANSVLIILVVIAGLSLFFVWKKRRKSER